MMHQPKQGYDAPQIEVINFRFDPNKGGSKSRALLMALGAKHGMMQLVDAISHLPGFEPVEFTMLEEN
jgi:hypothetical protein